LAKQLELNKETVVGIKEKLGSCTTAVITDYRGLNVAQVTKLRSQCREAGVEYRVLKNTLTSIAAKELGIEGLDAYLSGPTAIAFCDDAVAPAKVIFNFMKDKANKALEVKGGLLEGKVLDFEQIKALADLPSREELLAKVCGGMQAPLYGFASVLSANLRNFVYVLDAVREQKEANA
jgi:large subunit ribosomal protein L10